MGVAGVRQEGGESVAIKAAITALWHGGIWLLLAASAGAIAAGQDGDTSVWALSMDNDLFGPDQDDRDFTAGMALTYTGHRGRRFWGPLDDGLAWLDRTGPLASYLPEEARNVPSIELGIYGFTPDLITTSRVVLNDRPYASLLYLAAGRIYWDPRSGDAWTSSLTLGLLGLDLFEAGQRQTHRILSNFRAEGWDNQVSDGGEPTFRYHLGYHDLHGRNQGRGRWKTTYYLSLGYLTEAGVALSYRNGLISSPDHRFNPELTAYGERLNESSLGVASGDESYLWAGVALKARAYNVFLEGQFRDSRHTIDRSRVRSTLMEAWVGYTLSVARDWRLSYVLRAQSSEVEGGKADRVMLWGGLVFSHTLR